MKNETDPGRQSRRQHDRAFKAELVRESLLPGASISAIALRNGINANMLFKWRREHRCDIGTSATPAVLLPVEIAAPAEVATVPAPIVTAAPAPTRRLDVGAYRFAQDDLESMAASPRRSLRERPVRAGHQSAMMG